MFDQSLNTWAADADLIDTTSAPQNHSPLAALTVGQGAEIHLFYVSLNYSLASVIYELGPGYDGDFTPMNESFSVAADTRTLSVMAVPSSENGTSTKAIMLYEAPNGNITVLEGSFAPKNQTSQWLWRNISDIVYSSLEPAKMWLSPPVATVYFELVVQIVFFNSEAVSNISACPLYVTAFQNLTASCIFLSFSFYLVLVTIGQEIIL